jgi:hypothetical protein
MGPDLAQTAQPDRRRHGLTSRESRSKSITYKYVAHPVHSFGSQLVGVSVYNAALNRQGRWVLGISWASDDWEMPSMTDSHGLVVPTSTDTAFFAANPLRSNASLIAASFTGSATFGSVVILKSCRASRSEAISSRTRALTLTAG